MPDLIYLEESVANHPRAQSLCARFSKAEVVRCQHYGEVFNRKAQNFRLQKQNPAMILAQKVGKLVHPTPPGYGIGGQRNFYFSHLLNCLYDCRYCFLQGMFRSAHFVLFVNFEDFAAAIAETIANHRGERCWFFSGYDCDSLALESITGFVREFLPVFASHPEAGFELRTKSVNLAPLLETGALANVVVAYSLTPEVISRAVEHGAPKLERRLQAMATLAARSWPIGLRLDPLIYHQNWQRNYVELFARIDASVPREAIHSVTFGPLRFPQKMFESIHHLYPEEPLFAAALESRDGMIAHSMEIEAEMIGFCQNELEKRGLGERLFGHSPSMQRLAN